MSFRVRNMETRHIVPGIPTPFLIQQGSGDAYFVPNAGEFSDKARFPGIWYAKAPGHVSPDGTYTRVRIEHTEEWRVDVRIKPIGPDERDEEDAYDDYFIVEAATEQEAFRLGEAKATEDVASRFGDEYGSIVTTIGAHRT